MTSCPQHQYIIDEVGDLDRLPPATSRHVDECEECASFGRELLALRDLLREPDRVSAPADFDVRLAERLLARKAARTHWAATHRAPLAAAACLVVALSSTLALWPWADDARVPREEAVATAPVSTSGQSNAGDRSAASPDRGVLPSSASAASDARTDDDATVASTYHRRVDRRRPRAVPDRIEPSSAELEIVLQGTQGTHLLSVKPVLYGAQEILPEAVAVGGPGDAGPAVTSF